MLDTSKVNFFSGKNKVNATLQEIIQNCDDVAFMAWFTTTLSGYWDEHDIQLTDDNIRAMIGLVEDLCPNYVKALDKETV